MAGVVFTAGILANSSAALAAGTTTPLNIFFNAAVVMVPPGSMPPASMDINPSGSLFGCQSGPIASVRTKNDTGLTAVLLGGKAIIGYQKLTDPNGEALAETVFIECGKEIHRIVVRSQVDHVAALTQKKVTPAPDKTDAIMLIPTGTVVQDAQEAIGKEKDLEGEGRYAVPISAADLILFICDGIGPVSLRLPALPFVDTGTVIPSDSSPDAAYFKVNEATFDGDGEYRSAHSLWVTCGGIETKLQFYPGKIPGQVVLLK